MRNRRWKSKIRNLDKIVFNVAFVRSADGAVVEGVAGVALDNPPVPLYKIVKILGTRFYILTAF